LVRVRAGLQSRPRASIERGPGHSARSELGLVRPGRSSDLPNLRRRTACGRSGPRTTINTVPIYEFECRSCGQRFEELVGSNAGQQAADLRCPECGSADPDRLITSSYAPIHRQMTAAKRRRLEDKRGTDRGGARERFAKQRAAEKRAAKRRGSR
jgi:putative FmdB family regulatory protein